MKFTKTIAGALALGTATLLVTPSESQSFSLLGFSLGQGQRDFRVFNNFTNAAANNNVVPEVNFPGYLGAVLAIWKGCVEWSSLPHGDGTSGDTTQPNIGDGGANFDPSFQGENTSNGGSLGNTHAMTNNTNPGVFAFQQGASSGWRIRYYSNHTWADGPSGIGGGQADLQGIGCHEYGHALGLGHSTSGSATMADGTTTGVTSIRSINNDDKAGIQAIYGVAAGNKPVITGLTYDDQTDTVTITGSNFDDNDNDVWFTQAGAGGTGLAVKALGVGSTGGNGNEIVVTLPAGAGNGDVLVRAFSGFAGLSNPWPIQVTEIVFPGPPQITATFPTELPSLTPFVGSQLVTVTGFDFDTTNEVTLAGVEIDDFDVVDNETLTFLLPPLPAIGTVDLEIENDFGTTIFGATAVAPDVATLRLGNGFEPENGITGIPFPLKLGGEVGNLAFLWLSSSNLPTPIPGFFDLDIGNFGAELFYVGFLPIDVQGWSEISLSFNGLPPGTQIYWQMTEYDVPTLSVPPDAVSNVSVTNWLF